MLGLKPLSRSGPLEAWATASAAPRPLPGSQMDQGQLPQRFCESHSQEPPLAHLRGLPGGICWENRITEKQSAGQRTGASVVLREKQIFFPCLPKWRRGRDMCCESGCVSFWGGGRRRRILLFITPWMGLIVEIFKKLIIHFSFARN